MFGTCSKVLEIRMHIDKRLRLAKVYSGARVNAALLTYLLTYNGDDTDDNNEDDDDDDDDVDCRCRRRFRRFASSLSLS